jgi:MHS family proline/betaine transporter-like MFS transporter
MLGTFAVYALAFFARPLGGVIFGFLGDRIGRLRVLMLTVLLMGGGTGLTGLLPSYAAVGIAAPVLLVLCRLAQGLSMGGESSGGYSFIVESAPEGKRGRWIGIAVAFIYLPTTFAAISILGVHSVVGERAYSEWGWRIAFIVGGVIAVVGFWIRRTLEDPDEYKQAVANAGTASQSLREMLNARRSMLRVILLNVPMTLGGYMLVGYMYTFVATIGGVGEQTALLSNAVALLFLAALLPFFGGLTDRVGRKPLLYAGAAWLTITAYPAFTIAGSGTVFGAYAGQILLAFGVALFASAYFVTAVEVFPTAVRCSSHGLSTNLSVAIFGGTAPLVAAALVDSVGTTAPAFYMMLLIITLGVIGIRMTGNQKPQSPHVDRWPARSHRLVS